MENKQVGYLVIGIAIIMAIIVLIFNAGLKNIVGDTCTHGGTCSMYNTIAVQTWISMSIVGVILIIGLVIMFTKPKERVIIQKVKEKLKKKKLDLTDLNKDEKEVIKLLQEEKAIFQKDLMERLEVGKVKITRLLDKLEAKQFIERKRRGMNNVVVLRD